MSEGVAPTTRDPHGLNDDIDKTAKSMGLVAVVPEDDELFIDLDDDIRGAVQMENILKHLRSNGCPVKVIKQTTSKSGNTHVYLKVPWKNISPMTRVALQACLGSDPVREVLSLLRVIYGCERPPTAFFEVPNQKPVWQEEVTVGESAEEANPLAACGDPGEDEIG